MPISAASAAICGSGSPLARVLPSAAAWSAPPAWTAYDRPVQYGVLAESNVSIPMSDGVVLNAEVHRPDAAGRFPVLVTMTPYNGGSGIIGGANDYFVERGYVHVVVDVRGTGSSEGTWDDLGVREQRDGYELVEWAAGHQWSDGKVGMYGTSYLAITQIFTAALRPPHLKAIFPILPMGDGYRDMVFPGGQNNIGFIPFWLVLVSGSALIPPLVRAQRRPGRPGARARDAGVARARLPRLRPELRARRDGRRGRLRRAALEDGVADRGRRQGHGAHVHRRRPSRHLPARRAAALRAAEERVPTRMQIGKAGAPVSHISQAYPDRVEVRGRDLCGDLMGRLSFTEYFHLLLTGREPTEDQRFFLDLLLVAIAEHGMMPTNVAARMTLAADPGSLQGAVAAGILGCGPVILGTSEACARLLEEARAVAVASRAEVVEEIHAAGGKVPGFGHPVHRPLDPRAERILELADERGVSGPHVALARAFRDAVHRGLGQAADDERLDADRGGAARPRLSGRRPRRPFRSSLARQGSSRIWPRSASSRSASSWRGARRRRSTTNAESRSDEPPGTSSSRSTTRRYRAQLAYLFDRSAFYREKLADGGLRLRRGGGRARGDRAAAR